MTPRDFTARLALAFEPCDLTLEAVDIAIAHGAHESGWGKGLAYRLGCNAWNLTRTPKDSRPVIRGPDKEPDGHGGWKAITQRFRSYASDSEAAVDYLAFLRAPRYELALGALRAGFAPEFCRWLHDDDPTTAQIEGGFYTADVAGYVAEVSACLRLVKRFRAVPEVA